MRVRRQDRIAFGDGDVVGTVVGVGVGIAVGVAVGVVVVGVAVGVAVGAAVGVGVGIAVGVAVGFAAGDALGDALGRSSHVSHHMSDQAGDLFTPQPLPLQDNHTERVQSSCTAPSSDRSCGPWRSAFDAGLTSAAHCRSISAIRVDVADTILAALDSDVVGSAVEWRHDGCGALVDAFCSR